MISPIFLQPSNNQSMTMSIRKAMTWRETRECHWGSWGPWRGGCPRFFLSPEQGWSTYCRKRRSSRRTRVDCLAADHYRTEYRATKTETKGWKWPFG